MQELTCQTVYVSTVVSFYKSIILFMSYVYSIFLME